MSLNEEQGVLNREHGVLDEELANAFLLAPGCWLFMFSIGRW
jgi:hypothetical protein